MKKTARGFTLVELLVVIAIIAILAAVVVLIINPLELTRRSRDATRMTDLMNLQQAINIGVQEASVAAYASVACASDVVDDTCTENSLTGARATDGTGWVMVNLAAQSSVTVPTLPIDPTNSTALHYTYCGEGNDWIILAALESEQQRPKMTSDGGPNDAVYEVGSRLDITCVY